MSDKKYRLDLSLDQIELINELINFKIREEFAWNSEDYEEVMELSKYINQKLGYYEGQEKLDEMGYINFPINNIKRARYTLTEIYWEDFFKHNKKDLKKTGLHYGAFNSYEDAYKWLMEHSNGSVCPTGWDNYTDIYYYDERQYKLSKDDPEHGNNGYAKYFWVVEKLDNWHFKTVNKIDNGFRYYEEIDNEQ